MKDVSCLKYYRYGELTDILKKYAEEYPNLVRMESIGKSYEGRDIWAMTVTNQATGPDIEKPAYYIDGNIHSFEVSTTNTVLYILHYFVSRYGKDPLVTEALDDKVIYMLPRIDPDGAEYTLADNPKLIRSSAHPVDDSDPETGLFEDDIDGNGRLLYMRIKDSNGLWKKHPDYPQLMVKRDPIEHGGEYYRIVPEGYIKNYNGETFDVVSLYGLIDWPYGPWRKERIDINKNFPRNWKKSVKPGVNAGKYPTSEPETRAMVEFFVNHPNISGNIFFHTIGRVAYRPWDDKPDSQMFEEDLRLYKEIGEKGKEYTGYTSVDEYSGFQSLSGIGYPGNSTIWSYDWQGNFSWLCELWQPVISTGIMNGDDYVHYEWFKKHPVEQDIALYKWAKENFGNEAYVDWVEFDHPQLGKVEIGGWDWLFTWLNPPLSYLEKEISGFPKWVLWNTLITPKLELRNAEVKPLGGSNYRIRFVVQNTGYLPTYITKQAIKMGCQGLMAKITLPEGAKILSGKELVDMGQLEGRAYKDAFVCPRQGETNDLAMAEWIISAPNKGPVMIEAVHKRAGAVRTTLVIS